MRRRLTLATICALLVVAALSSAGCARMLRPDPSKTALARAALLQSQGRYSDSMDAYMTVAQGAYTSATRDLALAGVSMALTSEIATMPVTSRMAALVRFYHDTPEPLWPPALVPYTTGVLKDAADEQLAWADLFRADRVRWLQEYMDHGSADEHVLSWKGATSLDVKLLVPEQVAQINAVMPRLRQDKAMADLYVALADVARANRDYLDLVRRFSDGHGATAEETLQVGATNKLAGQSVARARAILRTMQ